MTGQLNATELKQTEYNIKTTTREEHAPTLHSSFSPVFPIWSDQDL